MWKRTHHAERCPVCNGTGIAVKGFYTQTSGKSTTAAGFEECKSCDGCGYVAVPDKEED